MGAATVPGIRSEEDLEAAVEQEAVHGVGAHTAADTVGRLQHRAGHAGLGEVLRAGQPGEARTDDHDVAHQRPPSGSRPVASSSSRLSAIRQTAR